MKNRGTKPAKEIRQMIADRIARVEGQLKGIRRMVEEKNGCLDVITQIMAARSALSMLGIELLKEEALCKNGRTKIDEDFVKKLFTLK